MRPLYDVSLLSVLLLSMYALIATLFLEDDLRMRCLRVKDNQVGYPEQHCNLEDRGFTCPVGQTCVPSGKVGLVRFELSFPPYLNLQQKILFILYNSVSSNGTKSVVFSCINPFPDKDTLELLCYVNAYSAPSSRGSNPNYGGTSFDFFPGALLTLFQVISLEGWSALMYRVEEADFRAIGNAFIHNHMKLNSMTKRLHFPQFHVMEHFPDP
eukprot:Gb_09890 [translate_table: standard]